MTPVAVDELDLTPVTARWSLDFRLALLSRQKVVVFFRFTLGVNHIADEVNVYRVLAVWV